MVVSNYQKQRILYYYLQGYRTPNIHRLLLGEKLKASRVGVAKFIKKFQETGCVNRLPGSGRPSKITADIEAIVDERGRRDYGLPTSRYARRLWV